MTPFIHTQKQQQLSMEMTIIHLIQSLLQLYQTFNNFKKRFRLDYLFSPRS